MTNSIISCACGCGESVLGSRIDSRGHVRRYRLGHAKIKGSELIQCACGCGKEISRRNQYGRWKQYSKGHSLTKHAKTVSRETRAKMSVAGKGRKFTAQHRRKIGEANSYRIVSTETKRKMAENMKSRPAVNPTRAHRLFVQLFKQKFGVTLQIEFGLVMNNGYPRYYDCKVPGRNILFELDGVCHDMKHMKKRDKQKDELAEKLGYELFRVPEDKIIEFITALNPDFIKQNEPVRSEL